MHPKNDLDLIMSTKTGIKMDEISLNLLRYIFQFNPAP